MVKALREEFIDNFSEDGSDVEGEGADEQDLSFGHCALLVLFKAVKEPE